MPDTTAASVPGDGDRHGGRHDDRNRRDRVADRRSGDVGLARRVAGRLRDPGLVRLAGRVAVRFLVALGEPAESPSATPPASAEPTETPTDSPKPTDTPASEAPTEPSSPDAQHRGHPGPGRRDRDRARRRHRRVRRGLLARRLPVRVLGPSCGRVAGPGRLRVAGRGPPGARGHARSRLAAGRLDRGPPARQSGRRRRTAHRGPEPHRQEPALRRRRRDVAPDRRAWPQDRRVVGRHGPPRRRRRDVGAGQGPTDPGRMARRRRRRPGARRRTDLRLGRPVGRHGLAARRVGRRGRQGRRRQAEPLLDRSRTRAARTSAIRISTTLRRSPASRWSPAASRGRHRTRAAIPASRSSPGRATRSGGCPCRRKTGRRSSTDGAALSPPPFGRPCATRRRPPQCGTLRRPCDEERSSRPRP